MLRKPTHGRSILTCVEVVKEGGGMQEGCRKDAGAESAKELAKCVENKDVRISVVLAHKIGPKSNSR